MSELRMTFKERFYSFIPWTREWYIRWLTYDLPRSILNRYAQKVGNNGDKRAVEPLIKQLEFTERKQDKTYNNIEKYYLSHAQSEVVRALGSLSDKRAVEPLLKMLETIDPSRNMFAEIVRALGSLGDKRAVEPLLKMLEVVKLSTNLSAIIHVLGNWKERDERLTLFNKVYEEIKKQKSLEGWDFAEAFQKAWAIVLSGDDFELYYQKEESEYEFMGYSDRINSAVHPEYKEVYHQERILEVKRIPKVKIDPQL